MGLTYVEKLCSFQYLFSLPSQPFFLFPATKLRKHNAVKIPTHLRQALWTVSCVYKHKPLHAYIDRHGICLSNKHPLKDSSNYLALGNQAAHVITLLECARDKNKQKDVSLHRLVFPRLGCRCQLRSKSSEGAKA